MSGAGDALWRLLMTEGEDDDRAPSRAAAMFIAHALIDLLNLQRDVHAALSAMSKK